MFSMSQPASLPDPSSILEMTTAFRRSKIMFAAISLGVFDSLANGPQSLATLAAQLQSNAGALERLLDACVGLELLRFKDGRYENSPAADVYLCEKSPHRVTGYLNYSNNVMWKMWGCLEDAVREGTHRWKQAYGLEGPIFSHFFRDEHSKREFLMGMHGFGIMSSPHVVAAFDLSQFQTFVDLGGATGHLAVAACERYPQLKGIVFDLPEAAPLATEVISASPVSNRIQVIAGDFFADPLPPADIYALGRILHDWSEEKIDRLLRRIYESLPTGGALLVAEKILNADRSGPVWAQMQNLNMLTCTEGKERTLSQYQALLTSIGFRSVEGRTTDSPLDAILAVK